LAHLIFIVAMSTETNRLSSVSDAKVRLRTPFLLLIGIVQLIFSLAHWFLYETWVHFWYAPPAAPSRFLWLVVFILSLTFTAASVLSLQTANRLVRWFYTVSAVWIGFGSFALYAATACWIVAGLQLLLGTALASRMIAGILFGAAVMVTIYGVLNASSPRVRTFRVKLDGLPESWRGKTAALVSDLHLGPVHGAGMSRKTVEALNHINPDIVFIPGDFYDGTTADLSALAAPWKELRVPLGAYFVAGNHEQFRDDTPYFNALQGAGIHILHNQKVDVDGLQIAGVHFADTVHPARYHEVLRNMRIDASRASVLLSHAPSRLGVPEQEGISLQLAGHTHGGQFWPYTWITNQIFGQYVHGLSRFGRLTVLTTYGVGTWGPPLRVGTIPEVVLIELV
jgi:predicted MPP superfamily phosphohydrolase